MAEPLLLVNGVSKAFARPRRVQALRQVSLHVDAGDFVSIVGPSGCGKSTLFNIVAGILAPSAGDVALQGQADPDERRLRSGYMFQKDLLFPWRNVLDNAALGLEVAGVCSRREARERARGLLPRFGLEGFEAHHPAELSGGMRQRVGLARALSVDAEVLLLDEPFSAVDEQNRRKFQEDLIRLRTTQNKTFIFVTHSIEEAVYLSDRIVLLSPRPGRISGIVEPNIDRSGNPDDIRRDQRYLDAVEEIWQGLRKYVE